MTDTQPFRFACPVRGLITALECHRRQLLHRDKPRLSRCAGKGCYRRLYVGGLVAPAMLEDAVKLRQGVNDKQTRFEFAGKLAGGAE